VFGAEITAIGLEGNAVQEVDLSTAIARMLEECENSIDSRFGIIYKRGVTGFKDVIESMIAPELISWDCVDPGRISVIPIEMAKGLEFESVIVITNKIKTSAITFKYILNVSLRNSPPGAPVQALNNNPKLTPPKNMNIVIIILI
jgi:hypothetical protein